MPDSPPLTQPPIERKDPVMPDLGWLQGLLKSSPGLKIAPGTCIPLPLAPDETPPAGLGPRKRECHI